MLGRVVVLFVFLWCGYAACASVSEGCDGYLSFLKPRCFTSCPLRDDYVDVVTGLLLTNVAGQNEAVQKISAALDAHDKTKPLVFHFAGDNGTGKTFTATLIGQGKYAKTNSRTGTMEGVLYIRGNNFMYDETGAIRRANPDVYFKQIETFKEQLRSDVIAQLTKCPESLIVFDEYTIPNRRVLSAMEEFLDGNPVRVDENTYITSKQATFIFLSDFGVEQFSQNLSFDQLLDVIEKDVSECWGDKLMKLRHLQNNIIPFRPLPMPPEDEIDALRIMDVTVPDGVKQMVAMLFSSLDQQLSVRENWRNNKITQVSWQCDRLCEEKVAHIIYYHQIKSSMYRYRNYRGIEQNFSELVTKKILTKLRKVGQSTSSLKFVIEPDMQTGKINYKVANSKPFWASNRV